MNKVQTLDNSSFAIEIERCCNQYSLLQMACAWCGDPAHILPYSYLTSNEKLKVEIIMGVSFNHSHPDSIKFFIDNGFNVKIFNSSVNLFHPKFYLFKKKNKYALFVGSSNFTFSGFYLNTEINMLIEGEVSQEVSQLKTIFKKWNSANYSFKPNDKWLNKYRTAYENQRKAERKNRIKTPRDNEESVSVTNWLSKANWNVYYKEVNNGLAEKERDVFGYNELLDLVKEKLPLPWDATIFDDIENRRIIGGMGKYGWLGHVAASGMFRKFMANGSTIKKRSAVTAINNICNLETPLNLEILSQQLVILTSIGPTIKVWSRILTILRPDIFCTVASTSVRANLSSTLGISKSHLETVDGYIQLIMLIQSCPWYNSRKPKLKKEVNTWERRAAYMDAIFY